MVERDGRRDRATASTESRSRSSTRRAFNEPTERALAHGIPVIAYNADGGHNNKRLAYVGQDLYQAGLQFGARIAELVARGRRVPLHRDARAS